MFKTLLPRTIWLVGLSLSLIVLMFGFARYWSPNQEETKMKIDNANLHITEANKYRQAVVKKERAVAATIQAEKDWLPYVETKTPGTTVGYQGIDLSVPPTTLLMNTKRFRNDMQRALNKQLLAGGVKVIQGPRIPGVTDSDEPNQVLASYYNYPVLPFPVVVHDLGQVQIQGTYGQIMANVRSWAKMPRYLVVAHGLEVQGTAPQLSASYNLSMVAYIRYNGTYPQLPLTSGGGGGAAPAQGGFPGPGGPGGPQFGGPGGPGGPGGRPAGAGGPPPGAFGASAGQGRGGR